MNLDTSEPEWCSMCGSIHGPFPDITLEEVEAVFPRPDNEAEQAVEEEVEQAINESELAGDENIPPLEDAPATKPKIELPTEEEMTERIERFQSARKRRNAQRMERIIELMEDMAARDAREWTAGSRLPAVA